MPRCHGDQVVEWDLEIEQLGHDIGQVAHSAVHAAEVHVGGDGIGIELLFDSGYGHIPEEAAAAMANVEDDATFAGFNHDRTDPAVEDLTPQTRETMCVDIAGAKFFEQEDFDVPFGRHAAEVDHNREAGERARL